MEITSKEYSVSVRAIYNENLGTTHLIDCRISGQCKYIVLCETDHSEKLDVEWNFNLECDKTWVSLPNAFSLSGQQASFRLEVDFTKFRPNSVQVDIVR